MAENENYNAQLNAAKAMKRDEIKRPGIPVDAFIQEAEDLVSIAKRDKQALTAASLAANYVEETTISIEALRQAQSVWERDSKIKNDANEKWAELGPKGFEFRNELLHSFRYAFRKDRKSMEVVTRISEGYSNADMVQDLSDLATLGRSNIPALEAIKFDITLLSKAESMSVELGRILGDANGERFNTTEEKLIRDAMYTILKKQVEEIRACGRYVFWKDPEKYKNYISKYSRNLRKKRERDDNDSDIAE